MADAWVNITTLGAETCVPVPEMTWGRPNPKVRAGGAPTGLIVCGAAPAVSGFFAGAELVGASPREIQRMSGLPVGGVKCVASGELFKCFTFDGLGSALHATKVGAVRSEQSINVTPLINLTRLPNTHACHLLNRDAPLVGCAAAGSAAAADIQMRFLTAPPAAVHTMTGASNGEFKCWDAHNTPALGYKLSARWSQRAQRPRGRDGLGHADVIEFDLTARRTATPKPPARVRLSCNRRSVRNARESCSREPQLRILDAGPHRQYDDKQRHKRADDKCELDHQNEGDDVPPPKRRLAMPAAPPERELEQHKGENRRHDAQRRCTMRCARAVRFGEHARLPASSKKEQSG